MDRLVRGAWRNRTISKSDIKIRRKKLSLQLNVSNLFDIFPGVYTSYSSYNEVESDVTKDAQVPNCDRSLDPRKLNFSALFDL
jgi:hypothetical protein